MVCYVQCRIDKQRTRWMARNDAVLTDGSAVRIGGKDRRPITQSDIALRMI